MEISAIVFAISNAILFGFYLDFGIWGVEASITGAMIFLLCEYHLYFRCGSGFKEYRLGIKDKESYTNDLNEEEVKRLTIDLKDTNKDSDELKESDEDLGTEDNQPSLRTHKGYFYFNMNFALQG